MPEKFALVSVSDKNDIERIGHALVNNGYRLLSTGGTAAQLREHGLPVTDVSDLTGFPEIMDGRVKTLHPKIHGGILARRDIPEHQKTLEDHDIPHIDFVIANLYPFSRVVARAETSLEEALENIDIGGPCMVRAAAKNYPSVTVVVEPADYDVVIEALDDGGPDLELRRELARKAFAHTARYDSVIADYLRQQSGDGGAPSRFDLTLEKVSDLRYGENPHQAGGLYCGIDQIPLGGFVQLHGKKLSYNNLVDLDGAYNLVREFEAPAAAVIKHTNPAGCAIGDSVAQAFEHALACDPMSAFGGIIVVNDEVTAELAETIVESFFEIVAAPSFHTDALEVLTRKKNLRLLTAPGDPMKSRWTFRPTVLGWLVQETDPFIALDREAVEIPTERAPSDEEWRDLVFAWRVCKHVKSNAIVLARDGATIGIGAGQMSRVDAVEIAVRKARTDTTDTVLASDAFFPFRDGPDAAAEAGVTAIIQPGGSRRDQEVIDACNEHGLAMVFTGKRHFRH
jgi:phosphoribosylaminoimidazolecarboxamide formyltransferase/IMP cyclohydrolase